MEGENQVLNVSQLISSLFVMNIWTMMRQLWKLLYLLWFQASAVQRDFSLVYRLHELQWPWAAFLH